MNAEKQTVVSFAEKRLHSKQFEILCRECFDLVEATAAYLHGDGLKESKTLKGDAANSFAAESMRLTANLMTIVRWVLLHQSVKNGEGTLEGCMKGTRRADIANLSIAFPRLDVPQKLRALAIRANKVSQDIQAIHRVFHPQQR